MLGAAGDGELEQSALREVTHHLNGCASCTGELSDYSTIGRELKAIAVLPSLEGFTKSVLDVIAKLAVVAVLAIVVHAVVFPTTEQVAKTIASGSVVPSSVTRPARLVDVQVDSAFVASADDSGCFHSSVPADQIRPHDRVSTAGRQDSSRSAASYRWRHDRDGGGSVRRHAADDDGESEAPERRYLCADRTTVERRHAAPADQPDQGGQRIYQSEISLTGGVTCLPRPCPPRRSRKRRRQ